ncbi:nickel permease [Novosphingobium sp. AAP83]|uniref:HoxN/HupN/NixA family nickel/cobalt transporter n=1 Tax=Novosphingobium sp. AAP83 TaxID=1523425 RepID=UPI0006B8B88B|nr:nickel permease [Novosphingobium sp. AAP83]KPF91586.1 nickel permease [Novosphingobium sp. AAP83]
MLPDPNTVGALGLIFVLGLRHGLDPDHIAVIDNMTFLAAEERPQLAPWIGTLFALGHSMSVGGVALGVSWMAGWFTFPAWLGVAVDVAIVAMLLAVGTLNLKALIGTDHYVPAGWRQALLPSCLRSTSHPMAVVAVGALFGLVFDTTTQAAAWGSIAATGGGLSATFAIIASFATGMLLIDTLDSQIVAQLLRTEQDPKQVRRYRRGVGWLIVALSYAMAIYCAIGLFTEELSFGDAAYTALGIGAALAVAFSAMSGWRRRILAKE